MNGILPFDRAQAYLLSTIDETTSRKTSYKLDRMRAFLEELGDPHLAYPTIHVGGTSGKGSTSTMIAGVLQAAGRRTGLHTKPHLRDATERARIDGIAIAPERFAALLDEMMPAIDRVALRYGRPTYYETLLALAFAHFAAERVDVAVVEVGLGGRLDGTNVVRPVATAITSVGYDHTEVLGDTLAAIAREKGGIAKPGVPFVVAPVSVEAAAVLEQAARDAEAPLVRVAEAVRVESATSALAGVPQRFTAATARAAYRVELPVRGTFQISNAATAIALLEVLPETLRPDRRSVERGLARVAIPGRMELFEGDPPVIFDIAHNAEKAAGLAASLKAFGDRTAHYVIAIGESKDASRILSILGERPSTFTFTSFTAAGRRAIPPHELAVAAQSLGRPVRVVDDAIEALRAACAASERDDLVVVTGSTFVVATTREWRLAESAAGERSA